MRVVRVFEGPPAGEDVLVHADDRNVVELQTLGAMRRGEDQLRVVLAQSGSLLTRGRDGGDQLDLGPVGQRPAQEAAREPVCGAASKCDAGSLIVR